VVVAPDAGSVVGVAASGSTLACAEVAVRVTAAMAAAAIASGAVPLPEADADVVVVVVAVTGTRIATAIGLGTMAVVPSCEAGVVESAVELSDGDGAVDGVEPSLEAVDFVRGR
jgi:hypothetical protein